MAELTIATLCGKEYTRFLDDWKKQLPKWVEILVYTDDSKGIFEAKHQIVNLCKTPYIWMIDVDDKLDLYLKQEWFFGLITNSPDKIVLGDDGHMLWQYIFKTSFIQGCYNEVEKAKQDEGIETLDLVSCEDMIVTATSTWKNSSSLWLPNKAVRHTVNDTSKTSSTSYNLQKLKSLYRSFPELLRASKHLDYDFMKWIVLNQCKNQYWSLYRQYVKTDEIQACDTFITNLYNELEKEHGVWIA